MAHSLSDLYLVGLLSAHEPPCLSLYQPTHRHYPDNQQDPTLFRNLVGEIENSLRRKYQKHEVEQLLQPFHELAGDRDFWNHSLDGLAVLCAPGFFRYYRLQRRVEKLAIVANSFHIKPLMRMLQSSDRFQVLGLNRKEAKLYEGDRYALDEIELDPGVPRTIGEALGEEHTEPHLTVSSYGSGAGGPAMYHGHGSRKDEVGIDTERFFRVIDRAVLEHHSRTSGLPLMLAALPEHHGVFRKVSRNPFLMREGVDVHPEALTAEAFLERTRQVFEPYHQEYLNGLVEEFGKAIAAGTGEDSLDKIALAAAMGRVETLLIEADRQVPGRLDKESGEIEFDELAHPDVDDLLDDLGEVVVMKGGRVIVVPADRMPAKDGAAAICRFKC